MQHHVVRRALDRRDIGASDWIITVDIKIPRRKYVTVFSVEVNESLYREGCGRSEFHCTEGMAVSSECL